MLEENIKIKYLFYPEFIAILFELEKYAFLIAFSGQENVHFVLNILFRRRKFVLVFLDFYFIF